MRKIVIAPYQMHKNLLTKYRQSDVFSDVKIISKQELLGEYYGRVSDKAIPFLMKQYHYSYDNCITILPYIPFVDEELVTFYQIRKDLIDKHLLVKNEYLSQFFNNNEVLIHGYSKSDKELVTVLNSLHVNYKFVLNETKNAFGDLETFETQFDEVFYTLNSIASLLDEGIDINTIYIYSVNNEYLYPLMKFSSDFGFKVDDAKSHSLYVTSITQSFLRSFKENKNIELAKECVNDCFNKELLEDLFSVVDKCVDEEMDFETQLDYLIGELKATNVSRKQYKNVVRIINKPIYEKGAHIFVIGFAQGQYPKSERDNELISDIDKVKIGLNSSLEETENNRNTLLDFFNSENHFRYSFAERSIGNKYFVSPLVKALNLESKKNDFPNIIYSKDMVDFYYAKLRDLKEFYKEESSDYHALEQISNIPYGKYDNSFTGVNSLNEDMELRHSYSKINDYYQCPFKYYVGNILGIDSFEGNFYSKFGTVAHKIFELHNDPDFDFDKVFDEEVKKQEFLAEELPIIENLRIQIKRASDAIKLHQHYMNNPKFIVEKKLGMNIGKKSYLCGVIDKSIIFDDKYLVLVDYKTGNDSFDSSYISEGVSLQLPTYCLLAKNDDELKNYQIIGTFINNVINTKLAYGYDPEALIDPYYRLNGKVADELDLIGQIDKTIYAGKSEFIKSVSITKEGRFAKSNSLVSEDEFDNYAEVALRKYLEADTNIRKNNFIINPLYKSKNDSACKYCEYRDICYVKKAQRRYLYNPAEDEKEDDVDE